MLNQYSGIIFDIGNILVKIDNNRAISTLMNLGLKNPALKIDRNQSYIIDFETGRITTEEFLERFCIACDFKISIKDLRHAWNTIIVDIDIKKLNMINYLKKNHRIFALSSNNLLHIERIEELYYQKTNATETFLSIFDHAFLSHKTGLLKPSSDAFLQLINITKMKPSELLFIDDIKANVVAAKQLNFSAIQTTYDAFFDCHLFKQFK